MVKRVVIASLLSIIFLQVLGPCPDDAAQAEGADARSKTTHRFAARMEGVVEHRIATPKPKYVAGERVIVYRFLTNLSDRPLQICETCLAESVRVFTTLENPSPACGSIRDHVPGFQPRMGLLGPGETREDQVDVTDLPCAFNTYGPGEYKVVSSYCYDGPDRQHDLDPPLYCVDAKEVRIWFSAR